MVDSIGANMGQLYSVSQESSYDNVARENVITTKLKVGDNKLGELNEVERADLQQKILELAETLNREMKFINTNIMFDYEDSISSLILTIKQRDSGEIIRQIPTDEALELMKKMSSAMNAILDTKG